MRRLALLVLLVLPLLAPGPSALAALSSLPPATVVTVPPLPGFKFVYAGRLFTTGADGSVLVPRSRSGARPPVTRTREWPLAGGGVAKFERWYGLDNLLHGSRPARAAVSTYRPVQFRFTKLTGEPVDRSSLGEITFKSSTGFITSLPPGTGSLQLQATRTVPDNDGLTVKEMYFTVQDVDVEGNNVVNRSQTKFVPNTTRVVDVPLLFFDASVRARDALFRFGVRGKLVLEYPNGRTRTLELDKEGFVSLPGLPRGQYHLSVDGPGLKLVQPVAMSKSQVVDLKMFTWLDVAVVLLTGLGVAVLLVLVGRRKLRHRSVPDSGAEARDPEVLAPGPELFDWRAPGHLQEDLVDAPAEAGDAGAGEREAARARQAEREAEREVAKVHEAVQRAVRERAAARAREAEHEVAKVREAVQRAAGERAAKEGDSAEVARADRAERFQHTDTSSTLLLQLKELPPQPGDVFVRGDLARAWRVPAPKGSPCPSVTDVDVLEETQP